MLCPNPKLHVVFLVFYSFLGAISPYGIHRCSLIINPKNYISSDFAVRCSLGVYLAAKGCSEIQ